VAQQLTETAAIMETVANDLYDISAAEPEFQEELKKNPSNKTYASFSELLEDITNE
jgi:stage II sporulation protein E